MNVQFRVIADDGCVGDTTKPIVVNPLPIPTSVKDTVVVCPGVAATFTVKSPVTGGVYNWYDASQGGNLVHTGTSFTISNVTTTVVYYLEATEAGCVSASRKKIVAMVMPVLTTPVAVVDSIGTNLIRFRWNAVPNAIGYEVSVNGSATWVTPSSGSAGLTHTVTGLQQLQTVTFRVKALGGCDEVQSLEVSGRTVVDHVFIPNSFSPNGDGLNDVLQVYSHIVKEMQFMVFNQWGEKIHESRDQRRAWDGMYKGKLQPAGVYMYVSRIVLKDGTVIQKKGSINLIR
jgi:gliding motility-associated-like protein